MDSVELGKNVLNILSNKNKVDSFKTPKSITLQIAKDNIKKSCIKNTMQ